MSIYFLFSFLCSAFFSIELIANDSATGVVNNRLTTSDVFDIHFIKSVL